MLNLLVSLRMPQAHRTLLRSPPFQSHYPRFSDLLGLASAAYVYREFRFFQCTGYAKLHPDFHRLYNT